MDDLYLVVFRRRAEQALAHLDDVMASPRPLTELWRPYLARLRDPESRPPDARLVHMFAHAFPRPEGAADHA